MNAYLLGEEPVTLVDTGLWVPESFAAIEAVLHENGLDFSDLDGIVLTHMHADHCGGVSTIRKRSNAPIYVHENARHTITGGESEFRRVESYFHRFFRECGAEGKIARNSKYRGECWGEVIYVNDGDRVLAGGREYEVLYAPGHSQTDIVLWHEQSGDAIVGDHLLKDISANAFLEPPSPEQSERPRALIQYRASMRRTQTLPFEWIYPGHGKPYQGHKELISERFTEHDERCNAILQKLISGRQTIYEISQDLFPWLRGNAVFLGLSEVLGHMDLLVEQSRVQVEERDGVLHFHSNS